MKAGSIYRIDEFLLDVENRQLRKGDEHISLNARYFDALVILVEKSGDLVSKECFFEEVWHDVVVADSALTQCIKDLRQHLGDDATNPRFIQTVPRYGYRFIGSVERVAREDTSPYDAGIGEIHDSITELHDSITEAPLPPAWQRYVQHLVKPVVFGTLGGGVAGVCGGLLYGSAMAFSHGGDGQGTLSVLLVMIGLTVLIGLAGALGISFGLSIPTFVANPSQILRVSTAAFGGLLVGGFIELLGIDAFNLLFGVAPIRMTGALEGGVLGSFLAMGIWAGGGVHNSVNWRPVAGAGLACAIAGIVIPIIGGNLLGGSLESLAGTFSQSQIRLDNLGRFFGEMQFGRRTEIALGGIEGLLFGAFVSGAIMISNRTRLWIYGE